MPQDALQVNATVEEALPNALYRVRLDEGKREALSAHAASNSLLRLLPGDPVVVEISAYDATRGRIVRRRS